MFWIGLKVLLLRQLYGLKHRWIIAVCSVILPVLLLALMHVGRAVSTASLKTSNPLKVVVLPFDSEVKQLIDEALTILRSWDNSSSSDLQPEFPENIEEKNRLGIFKWSSIEVQFHNIRKDKLEYSLYPSYVAPRTFDFSWLHIPSTIARRDDAELSRTALLLQTAIDAAYIQKYVPDRGYLRLHFPNSSRSGEFQEKTVEAARASDELSLLMSVGIVVSFGLILIMTVLASYVTRDKLSGVRELLCINGMPRWMTTVSWLFSLSLPSLIIALCQLLLLILPFDNPILPNIRPSLLAVLLVLHGWSALIFANFVANLLNNHIVTSLVICLYWVVSSIFSWLLAGSLDFWLASQAFLSLLPNFGFSMFLTSMEFEFHEKHTVLSFGNLFSTSGAYISPGLCLILILVHMFIFLILVFYLDIVKPGPYGRATPWYLFRRRNLASVRPADAPLPDESTVIQKIPDGVPIGLECVDIVKTFGTHTALNNVNLKVVKNSITILLGHNGAGKTTLFSILSGMFSPTSGEVYTDEFNIFYGSNLKRFRSVLGYCPQRNLLLKELTVHEHLMIFGMLKGLSKSQASAHSEEWSEKFDMTSMRNTTAKNLSGGFKRKLCLAIAMTGEPEYLLLDEPSAGLDIESTRKFCDLMLKEKGNCTVVITTHNMDEADILGDRVAVLAEGQVKCYGESSFLKEELDTGIRLSCTVISSSTQEVIDAVRSYMASATVLHKMNRSVTFRLPYKEVQEVPNLLHELEQRFGDGISSTLSPSTLDDVFIKVQKDLGVKVSVEQLPAMSHSTRSWSNFRELLRKRATHLLSRRMVTVIMWVIVLPCLAVLCDMFVLYAMVAPSVLSRTAEDKLFQSESDGQFALIKQRLLPTQRDDFLDLVRSTPNKTDINFKEFSNAQAVVGNTTEHEELDHQSKVSLYHSFGDSGMPIAYFPSRADSSISLAYSNLVNALLLGNASIVTHRGFYKALERSDNIACPISPAYGQLVGNLFALVVLPFFLVASAYFLVFPHMERITLFKHLQLMTGLQPAIYWLANLAFDLTIYTVSCILFLTILAIFDLTRAKVFINLSIVAFAVVLFLYSLCSITFSYVWSFTFRANAIAILLLFFSSVFLTLSMTFLTSFFQEDSPFKFVYFLPFAILWGSIINIVTWALQKASCDMCGFKKSCQYLEVHPLFEKELKDEMICFAAFTLVYFFVLLFLDHGLGKWILGSIQRRPPFLCCSFCCFGGIEEVDELDPDVASEKQRVDNLRDIEEDLQPQFVCDSLGKKFSHKMTAVYDVTFTAERGECFGLVGVNGAGKSTTFGMLAALLCPSEGTALIDGQWELAGSAYEYKRRVGYCPQSGGLMWSLSANTILRLFGRLAGVPSYQVGPLVDQWIQALDMNEIAHRPCGYYSGGNQRKLSLAVALIGTPPVVLLDEPTAGVDPVLRWRIWEILTACLERNDQSLILTSHTMTECEAICSRLTIMVGGMMQCIGPIPILKQHFGKSYVLEVKLWPFSTVQHQYHVQSMIESRFAGFIELQNKMLYRLVFLLKTEDVKIYELFEEMLKIKLKNRMVEYFHLSETPLEQVFLMYARNQQDDLSDTSDDLSSSVSD